jgi:murein DD-endopeptidase MepM/ murein hydrolase activator NlpD
MLVLTGVKWLRSQVLLSTLVLAFACIGCGVSSLGGPGYASVGSVFHRVAPGDTLHTIGQRYGVSYSTIAHLNGIRDANSIEVGQRLLVAYAPHRKLPQSDRIARLPSSTASLKAPSRVPNDTAQLLWPVDGGGRLVSKFGPRARSFHDGIDIAARSGTPVLAAHSGVVVHADNQLSGYGKLLIVKAPSGMATVYAHNRRFNVRKGDYVKKGQQIAEVGSTGRSSGPHLHFEVRVKDKGGRSIALDPLPLLGYSQGRARYRFNDNLRAILAKVRG